MSLGKTRGAAAALLAISMLVSLAAAQAASAATISTSKACTVANDSHETLVVPVTGSGFTPGEHIVVKVREPEGLLGYSFFVPDEAGNISGTIKTEPFYAEVSVEKVALKVQTVDDEIDLAEAPTWMAYREVTTEPWHDVKPHQTVSYEAAGFKSGKPVYAHFLHKGKEVLSQKIGKATGPCGLVRAKATWFPAKHSHFDRYDVQYDNSKRYSPKTHPKVARVMYPGKF